MIAALFVQKDGCYFNIPGVEPYDEDRDAFTYRGPYPVVAHPPCQLWGKFARVNYKRWGGDHNKPGNDDGAFSLALALVRQLGGVLEHPANSYAWKEYALIPPAGIGWRLVKYRDDSRSEWVCEVWQSAYGHKARKRTWLYYCGFNKPADLDWSRQSGTHQIGARDYRRKSNTNKPTVSKREASATPPKFRDALLSLAELSRP